MEKEDYPGFRFEMVAPDLSSHIVMITLLSSARVGGKLNFRSGNVGFWVYGGLITWDNQSSMICVSICSPLIFVDGCVGGQSVIPAP